MTTPNQQPEVSQEVRRQQIKEWIERHNLSEGNFTDMVCAFEDAETINLQRAIGRATEKLRQEILLFRDANNQLVIQRDQMEKLACEQSNQAHQLRTELAAQKQLTEAEHRSFEIMREQWEKLNDETRVLRAENEAPRKDAERLDWLEFEVNIRKLIAIGPVRNFASTRDAIDAAMAKGEAK